MITFSDRMKAVRGLSGKNQTDFAKEFGLTRDQYANIEYDRVKNKNVIMPALKAICNKYHISEAWLLEGEGEMNEFVDHETEISEFTANLFKSDEFSFKYQMIKALADIPEERLEPLRDKMLNVALNTMDETSLIRFVFNVLKENYEVSLDDWTNLWNSLEEERINDNI